MGCALSEDEAVAPAGESLDDVAQDLFVAGVVLGDLPVHRRHGTRRGQIAVTHISEGRRVDAEDRRGAVMARRLECAGLGRLERVPYRPELERDQVVESVAPVRRGGEPHPPAGWDRAGGRLECGRRKPVASGWWFRGSGLAALAPQPPIDIDAGRAAGRR